MKEGRGGVGGWGGEGKGGEKRQNKVEHVSHSLFTDLIVSIVAYFLVWMGINICFIEVGLEIIHLNMTQK